MKSLKTVMIAAVAAMGMALGAPDVRAMEKNIVQTAVDAGKFATLTKALGAAELVDTLKGKGPFTIFAPTDDAFRGCASICSERPDSIATAQAVEKVYSVGTYPEADRAASAAEHQAKAVVDGLSPNWDPFTKPGTLDSR